MHFKPETYSDERRLKYPSKWSRIDAGKSPSGAIDEFCKECLQSTTAHDCTSLRCALFPYRPGADKDGATQRRPGIDVPSPEDYEAMLEAWRTEHPEAIERGKAMRQSGKTRGICDICQKEAASVVVRDGIVYCAGCDDGEES